MFCSKCGKQIPDDSLFCYKCGSKSRIDNASDTIVVQNIRTVQTVNYDVKEYLTHAKSLEVNRYTIQKTIIKIDRQIETLGHSKTFDMRKCSKFIDFLLPFIITLVFGTVIFGILEEQIGLIIVPIVAIIIGAVRYFVKDDRLYNEHLKIIDADKERVECEKRQIIELRKQQDDMRCQIKEISDVLENLYALNVIYPKYREMLPIITMWEYLDSGRCTDLTGANGAYNLYESESRQNIIISNLNQAVSMLAQIRDNQYALYSAIEESNALAERMCYQNERLLSSNESIKCNSEIAAHNSKIAVDNSSVSAYIDFCKY